ncbi:hypothetical protein ACTFIZ_000341 [Dictyostelium cf. discoideum]
MSFSTNNFKINRINNSNNYEKSFWKIFGNFYLLKLIINKINSTEWIKFENPKQINHFKNRKKFKDITSLKWMIKKKLFTLLKLKINNNDEFINIDIHSIYELFRSLSLTPNSINVLDNTTHGNKNEQDDFIETQENWIYFETQYNKQKSTVVIYNENDIIQIKEILNLLLNKRRNEFEICDLTNAAINCNSLYVLKILISEPYFIDVIPSSILLAYRKCDPIIILELFKFNKSIFSYYEIKIHSLEKSSKNKNNSLEMVKFILENEDLYKLSEIEKQSPISYVSLFFIEISQRKLKVENVLKLKCLKTIKILMELNMIKPSTFVDNSFFDLLNINNTFEELKTILLFYLNYFPKLKNDKEINKKLETILKNDCDLMELQKLIIINLHPIKFYKQYIKNYHQSIDECHLDGLVSNDYDMESNQFIAFYRLSTLLSYGGQYTFISFNFSTLRNLQLTANDIKKRKIKYFHPLLFDVYDSSKLSIDNISIVDWLIDNNMMLSVLEYSNMISIKFKSFDLGLSCFLNYEVLRNLKKNLIFERFLKDFFFSSIENESIIILKKIINIVQLYINVPRFYNTIENFLPNNLYISLKVFNFFNENCFDGFNDQLLYKFLKLSIEKHPSLKKVKINHNLNGLYDLILYYPKDLNLVKLFLNNIDKLNEDEPIQELNNIIYNEHFDLIQNHFKTKKLISIIKLIISKFNNTSNVVYILNHYFNILIRNYGVTIETIKTIQDLLFENSIIIKDSTYRIFYYLNTRSPKFTKLILTGIKLNWFNLGTDQINKIEIYISASFNYKYLTDYEQQEFNGNLIFKNSFDIILKELISNIIFKINQICILRNEIERLTKPLLIYFLNIGRRDLFLENYHWFRMMLYKHLNNLSIIELIEECSSSTFSPSIPSNGNLILLKSISPIFRTNYFNANFKQPIVSNDFDLNLFFKSCNQYELSILIENNFNSKNFLSKALFESFDYNNIDNLNFLIENYNHIQLIGLFNYKKSCFPSLKLILNNFPQKFYNHIIIPIDIQKEFLNDLEFFDNFLNYIYIYFNNNIDSLKLLNSENDEINQFIQELIIKIRDLITTNQLLLIEKNESKKQKSDKYNEIKSIVEQKEIKDLLKSNLNNYLEIRDSQRNSKKSEYEIKYLNDDNNLFIQSFINGDIKQCELLLLHFKNFILTESSITKTIINNNIFIIKYFYHKLIKNNLILLNYLKSQLLKNYDYKYNLNWLE